MTDQLAPSEAPWVARSAGAEHRDDHRDPREHRDHRDHRADHRDHRDHRDQTRRRIIEEALQLIADHGFAATSTREISDRLGFTKAALYYHFRTKADLLAAIVEPAMHDLVALAESASASSTPPERRRVVEGYVELVASHADLIKVLNDDPSVRKSAVLSMVTPRFHELVQILAGTESPGVVQRARVRAALGAVHMVLLHAEPDDDPVALRETAVTIAVTVLGLPPRRKSKGA